jgi:heterodisulfide reductase subunit C
MYHEGYGNNSLARDSLEMIPASDLERCSECSSCSVICRRGIDMKAQIKVAEELMVRRSGLVVEG